MLVLDKINKFHFLGLKIQPVSIATSPSWSPLSTLKLSVRIRYLCTIPHVLHKYFEISQPEIKAVLDVLENITTDEWMDNISWEVSNPSSQTYRDVNIYIII